MKMQRTPQAATATLHTSADFAVVLRKHMAHALVAAVLGGVAWAGAVRPLEAAMTRDRAESSRMANDISSSSMSTAPREDIEQQTRDVDQRVQTTIAWVSQLDDATEIYDSFMRVARGAGVSVQRIDPTGTRPFTSRSTVKAPPMGKVPEGPTAELTGYRVSVQGTYPQLVAFLGACETQLNATRVVSFRIAPSSMVDPASQTAGVIEAAIETSHVKINMPQQTKSGQSQSGGTP